jgi:hypothetical protein
MHDGRIASCEADAAGLASLGRMFVLAAVVDSGRLSIVGMIEGDKAQVELADGSIRGMQVDLGVRRSTSQNSRRYSSTRATVPLVASACCSSCASVLLPVLSAPTMATMKLTGQPSALCAAG